MLLNLNLGITPCINPQHAFITSVLLSLQKYVPQLDGEFAGPCWPCSRIALRLGWSSMRCWWVLGRKQRSQATLQLGWMEPYGDPSGEHLLWHLWGEAPQMEKPVKSSARSHQGLVRTWSVRFPEICVEGQMIFTSRVTLKVVIASQLLSPNLRSFYFSCVCSVYTQYAWEKSESGLFCMPWVARFAPFPGSSDFLWLMRYNIHGSVTRVTWLGRWVSNITQL